MGKAVKSVAKGIGKVAKSPLGFVTNPVGSLLAGGLPDFLKTPEGPLLKASPIAGDVIALQKDALGAQKEGLQRLRDSFGTPPEELINRATQREISQVGSGVQDITRRARERIARSGLGNTSIGQLAETGANREAAQRIAQIRSSRPERIQALREARANALLNAGGSISRGQNVPIRFEDQRLPGGPSPLAGIGTLIGGGAGAYFGGPSGALAGAQAGNVAGSGLGSLLG